MPLFDPESPCIGYCSTVFGDSICRGCNRYFEEVLAWQTYSLEEKQQRTQRIADILSQTVSLYVQISNPALLKAQLARKNIAIPTIGGDAACVLALLQAGAEHINSLSAYGLQLQPQARGFNALQLLKAIESTRRQQAEAAYISTF